MLPEYPRSSGPTRHSPIDRGLLALLVLQAGATVVVLAALPYQLFQLDRYTFVRRAYLQRREYLVYDGKPPPEKDE